MPPTATPNAATTSRRRPALIVVRASRRRLHPALLGAERRVGTGHGMRLPVPGNAYAAMASAIASATRTARSLSRGSTRTTPPAGSEIAATAALSLARERFAEKRASGSRPRPVVRRSCLRPRGVVSAAAARRVVRRCRGHLSRGLEMAAVRGMQSRARRRHRDSLSCEERRCSRRSWRRALPPPDIGSRPPGVVVATASMVMRPWS